MGEAGVRRTVPGLVAAAVAACTPTPRYPAELAAPPPPAAPPVVPADPAPAPVADTCGARPFRTLLGRPRSEIPVAVRPERQRVACSTCPVTMDYDPERLNFLFDAKTGLITDVKCG